MKVLRLATLLAITLAVGACENSPTDADGQVRLIIAADTALAHTEVSVTLANLSGESIGHGILPCTAGWERREGDDWVPVLEPRVCILPLLILRNGGAARFTATTPDEGTYRLVIGASWNDRRGEFTEFFTIRSNTITVH